MLAKLQVSNLSNSVNYSTNIKKKKNPEFKSIIRAQTITDIRLIEQQRQRMATIFTMNNNHLRHFSLLCNSRLNVFGFLDMLSFGKLKGIFFLLLFSDI